MQGKGQECPTFSRQPDRCRCQPATTISGAYSVCCQLGRASKACEDTQRSHWLDGHCTAPQRHKRAASAAPPLLPPPEGKPCLHVAPNGPILVRQLPVLEMLEGHLG